MYDCIRLEKKSDWGKFRENDGSDHLEQIRKQIFFHEQVEAFIRNTINESLDCLKKNLGKKRCFIHVARVIFAMTTSQRRSN